MSSIPYNYGKYIDDKVSMTNNGTVDASRQIQSPASAGSRGLAKTTQFTKDQTQMKMGESITMEDMKSLISRIDGLNVPTNEESNNNKIHQLTNQLYNELVNYEGEEHADVVEDLVGTLAEFKARLEGDAGSFDEAKSGIEDHNYKLLMLDISAMKDRIAELNIDDDSKTRALTALGDVEDELNFDEAYEPFPEEDEMTFEDDDAFYEAFGELGFPEDENELFDAEYRGRKVPLNKPMRGDVKKFKVYVKDPKSGNVKKVNFGHGGSSARKAGQKTMKIRKSNPKARKSFRARHNCANPGPKTKARYWSCRKW